MNLLVDKIFICHWDKLMDRKEKLVEHLNSVGLTEFEFITSYDKETWDIDEIKKEYPLVFDYNNSLNRHLRWSEISLVLKHIEILKNIVKNNIKTSLIFEDDVILPSYFIEKCNDYIKQLPDDWDLCWVGTCCNIHAPVIEGKNIYRMEGSRCTHAFLITLECAKKVLDELKFVDLCADYYYNFLIKRFDLNNYWVEPPIALQTPEFNSTIQTNDLF